MNRKVIEKTKRGKVAGREQPVSLHIPYAAHIDDHTVITKDDMLLQVIAIGGYRFETADQDVIEHKKEMFNTLLKGKAKSEFALWTHLIRRRENAFPEGSFGNGFAKNLNGAWQAQFNEKEMFVNELYLTVVRKSGAGKAKKFVDVIKALSSAVDEKERQYYRNKAHKELNDTVEEFIKIFKDYGARRLGVYETPMGPHSSLLSFISYLVNLEKRPVMLPTQGLDTFLPARRVSFGNQAIELHGNGLDNTKYAAMVSIKEYPNITNPGILDPLLSLPHEIVVSQSFCFMDRERAIGLIASFQRKMEQVEDRAISLINEMDEAMDDLSSGRIAYGEHHCTVLCKAGSLYELDDAVVETSQVFTNAGNIPVREDINLEPAFWAQLPGNTGYIGRKAPISSKNFAALASFHNYPVGKKEGNHWGPALSVIETVSGTPYYFNYHKDDVGNSCIFGKTGTGKTTLINFTLAQSLKYGGRRIVFDKDRGAEIFIRAMGGNYTGLKKGMPSGFNPLQMEDTEKNRIFLYGWLKLLAAKGGGRELSSEDENLIESAIRHNFEKLDPKDRRIAHLMPLFGNSTPGSLRSALEKWVGQGIYGWVFDNEKDAVSMQADITGFEMGAILDDKDIRTPVTSYLFHRVEEALDGTRVVIVLEEGWRLIEDQAFEIQIENWERTIRKLNGMIVFLSQQPEGINSRIGRLIFNQSVTRIYYPNNRADKEVYINLLGLSERQYELIKTLPPESRTFLLEHGNEAVVAKLDMSGMEDYIAVLSGRAETVGLMEQVIERCGNDPGVWLPEFYKEVKSYDI